MSETNYKAILKSIKAGRCILILGSEVAKYTSNEEKNTLIKKKVVEKVRAEAESEGRKIKYYEEDEFYLFSGIDSKTIPDTICDFYSNINDNYNIELYEKLAQLPFHLIISLSPDQFLLRSMRKFNSKVNYKNWSFIKDDDYPDPDSKNPLIYYLFGNIEDQESLVLTHEKFFKYTGHILNDDGISKKLIKSIQKATYFIFLGIRFDKWYSQIFVRLIDHYLEKGSDHQHLKQINEYQQITTAIYGGGQSHSTFYKEQFGIELIDSLEIEKFVDELYEKAKNYNGENLLKLEKIAEIDSKTLEILTLLNESRFEKIFEDLANRLSDIEKLRVDLLKNRYELLQEAVEEESITKRHEETEKNKIRSLLRRSINLLDNKYSERIENDIHETLNSNPSDKTRNQLNEVKNQWEDLLDKVYSGELDEEKITLRKNEISNKLRMIKENLD